MTPLLPAPWTARMHKLVHLLVHGADTDQGGGVWYSTPLHVAAWQGDDDLLRNLLNKHSADVSSKDSNGGSPLHYACCEGHLEVARLLLENGADVSTENNDGITPVQCAVQLGHVAVAALLLEYGAELPTETDEPMTELEAVALLGCRGA